jgi:hypothetical protein
MLSNKFYGKLSLRSKRRFHLARVCPRVNRRGLLGDMGGSGLSHRGNITWSVDSVSTRRRGGAEIARRTRNVLLSVISATLRLRVECSVSFNLFLRESQA